jgi:hypothetical protein
VERVASQRGAHIVADLSDADLSGAKAKRLFARPVLEELIFVGPFLAELTSMELTC